MRKWFEWVVFVVVLGVATMAWAQPMNPEPPGSLPRILP